MIPIAYKQFFLALLNTPIIDFFTHFTNSLWDLSCFGCSSSLCHKMFKV